MPRLFNVIRIKDISGVSGCGKVAVGVEFDTRQVVVNWICRKGKETLEIHKDIDCFIEIHGHNGATKIEYIENGKN